MPFHLSIPQPSELEKILPENISIPNYKSYFHISGFRHPLIPILTSSNPENVQSASWGLIPHDTKNIGTAKALREKTLNSKAETLFSDPLFYNYIPHNRCLVFVNGFFEWKQKGKEKIPHFVHMADQKPFAIAGVFAHWSHPQLYSPLHFSIITTEAEGLMSLVNNTKSRMPHILPPSHWNDWLNTSIAPEKINELLLPYDEPNLRAYQVSGLVNSSGQDTNVPEVLEKFADFTMDEDDFF